MTQSNFQFPVVGVTGTTFKTNMDQALKACASSHNGNGFPSVVFPGMPFVGDAGLGTTSLSFFSPTSGQWETVIPDIDNVTQPIEPDADVDWTGNHSFDEQVVFNGGANFTDPVTITAVLNIQDSPAKDNGNKAANTRYVRRLFKDPDFVGTSTQVGLNSFLFFDHGFNAYPSKVTLSVSNIGAQLGFDNLASNIELPNSCGFIGNTGITYGHTLWYNNTGIGMKIAPGGTTIIRPDNGNHAVLLNNQWTLTVSAWK